MKYILLFTLSLLTLSGCGNNPPAPADEQNTSTESSITLRKSPNDDREYRYLQLPNKLRVVLVSDPTTEKAAAAMAVFRGSNHEPEAHPGLAHFLEHMLFIQTEAYPEPSGFQDFVSANGGSTNAYTALDHTNYFFDVQVSAFPEALDRWGHFFISPIISPEYSQREKNAVDSEYQMQLKNDGWRGYMVGKQAINPEHPNSRFTIGSLDVLEGDIHNELVEFFETHYSADQMGLVVVADQSLDDLEAMVTPLFGQIENKDIGPAYPTVELFKEDMLPATLKIQTIEEGASISYLFPLPAAREHYKNKPEQYFSNLLGHEGKGSLHELLTSKGWIQSLGAGVGELDRNTSAMLVNIDLTPLGEQHTDEITNMVFQAIELIKQSPAELWRFEEQAIIAEMAFRFQEKSSATGLVYQLAPRIDEYPPADLLVAPYLMEEFDAQVIEELLSYLRPDNVLVEISGPDIVGDQVEPWFKVPFSLASGDIAQTTVADVNLSLPEENPYLPENLELVAANDEPLQQYVQTPELELWLNSDVQFGSPRANIFLELAIEDGLISPSDRAIAQLYRMIVQDALSKDVYPAYLAGLSYSISVPDSGYEIRIGGYQDQQQVLLESVLDAFLNTELDAERFATLKNQLIKDWRNAVNDRPYSQAFSAISDTLRSGRWPRPMLIDALEPVKLADVQSWRQRKLDSFAVRGLVHGNVEQQDAQQLVQLLRSSLTLAAHDFITPEVKDIDNALRLQLEVDHADAAMVLHVQNPDESFASRARSSLAAQIMHPSYFQELRTEQQLGYVVSVSNRPVANRGGVSFIVQSPNTSAAELEQATLEFVDEFVSAWPEVSSAEFEQQKSGLITRLLENPKNLNEASNRYWADLTENVMSFDSREQVADLVAGLTQEDMQAYFGQVREKLQNHRLLVFAQGRFEAVPQRGQLLGNAAEPWAADAPPAS
ncbi:MAG: insulinase family protein [Pseudomonadaceae bacterium]|nr:insulinase family protein [Pseudomonadaceae bacterium]